jgi:hypothetical protein
MTEENSLDLEALWNESDDDGVTVSPEHSAGNGATEGQIEDDSDMDDNEDVTDDSDADEGDEQGDDEEQEEAPIDYKALWTRSQNEIKTMAGRLHATEARLLQEKEELAKKIPAAPIAPSEEEGFLAKFRDTYSDDVVKAIEILAAKQASSVVESTLQPRLSSVESVTSEILTDAHFDAIERVHPDIDDIDKSPVFNSWLETRPAHLRPTYEFIRANGTPAQVIAMIDEYKENIGAAKPKTKNTTPAAQTNKIIAATAVGRRRGTVQTSAEAEQTDLEAIWAETDD